MLRYATKCNYSTINEERIVLTERIADLLDSAVAIPLDEAAPLLRYTPASLRLAVRQGRIPGVRVGGRWMIPTDYLRKVAAGAA